LPPKTENVLARPADDQAVKVIDSHEVSLSVILAAGVAVKAGRSIRNGATAHDELPVELLLLRTFSKTI
jgi:hypothetical protein